MKITVATRILILVYSLSSGPAVYFVISFNTVYTTGVSAANSSYLIRMRPSSYLLTPPAVYAHHVPRKLTHLDDICAEVPPSSARLRTYTSYEELFKFSRLPWLNVLFGSYLVLLKINNVA